MLLCLLMVVGVVAPSVSAAQPIDYGNGLTSDDVYFGEGSNIIYNDDGSFTVNSSDKGESLSASSDSAKAPVSPVVPEELGEASATVGDTTVDALGVPKDSSLTIQEAKPETESAIDQVVADQDGTSSELFRYDISVQDKNGLDWQPNGMVRLELDAGKPLHKNQKVYVVHVSDDGVAERIDARVNAAGKIEFETEGFSTFAGFTVDFEYENAKFSINGLTSILLSEVFQKLNAPLDVEDVKDVAFTDYSLISIEKQGADWKLTSLKAFQTTEALTMTMKDGQVYEIKVTDAITTMANFYEAYYGGGAYNYIDGYAAGGNAVVQLFLNSSGSPTSNDDISSDFDTQPLVIDGRGVGGCMEIVLQKASGAGNTLVWDLVQLKITGGAKVVIRLGNSFSGTETVTINSVQPYSGYAARPLFDIYDGSLYFNLGSDDASLVPSGTGLNVQSESSVKQIIFDGNDLGASASVPLIYHHRGVDETNRQNIVVRGVTFRDAKHRAVLVQTNNMNNLIFRDCTFSSTVRDVEYGGGAIYIDGGTDGSTSNVVDVAKFGLYNCTFSGNTGASGHGGAIVCYGDVHTLDIDGCKFENCTSANRGGAIEFSVNTKTQDNNIYDWFRIKDTTFSNCTASSHGGAIDISNGDNPLHLAADITIDGCTFTNCKATKNRGGAIRMVVDNSRNLTIKNSGFSGCTSVSPGGAISVQGTIGNVSISGGKTDSKGEFYTFRDCKSSGARGGGVAIKCPTVGNITLSGASFLRNTAGTLGGGFHVGIASDTTTGSITAGAVSVTGCTFSGNTAGGVGGALSFTDGTYASFDINTNTFTGNFSANFGGAIGMKIYAEDAHDKFQFKVTGNVSITDNTFKDNGAGGLSPEKDKEGNLLTWDHDSNPTTAEIQKLNGTGGGGAICIGGTIGGTITIKDTTKDDAVEFENCYTWNNGGAICILGDLRCKKIDILNVDMYQCKARDAGNAFYISNAIVDDLLMENCTMKECTYFEPGCGIEIFPSTYASLGDDAYAAYDSSGTFRSIGNTTCRAVIRNCTFYKNESYSNGGGVYWNANDVRKGFDGTTDIVPSLKIYGGSFQGNTAFRDGGAIYCEAEILVDGTQIFENEARQGGGIAQQVYNNPDRPLKDGEKTKVTLSSTTNIYNNKAIETAMVYDANGNPIYSGGNGGGISIMANATSSLNNTVEPGQEGWIQHYVQFQLNGASLYNNTADHNGGGLYFLAKDATDGESAANIAEIEGYVKQIIIDGGSIYSNTAGRKVDTANGITASNGHGGGIYMKSSANTELLVSDGDIYKNTCYDGNGGGIYLTGKGALCTITGGTIGGDTEDKANAAVMNTYQQVQTKGCGGGIAIDGGATIIMRRPWKVNAQNQYLDKDGNVTNDPTQYVEDETKAGGTIANNKAHIQGAGIWLNNKQKDTSNQYIDGTQNTIVINGGTIKNNVITAPAASSANGGGVYVGAYGSLTMNGGSIIDCEAKGWGGGVYCYSGASFTLNGGNIGSKDHPNKSTGGGGIAFQSFGTCTINGGTIAYNESTGHGGGILMCDGGTVSITGGDVEYNKATIDGGGIWGVAPKVTISDGSVKNNSAVSNGGGLYIQNASSDTNKTIMSGGNIESNTAANGAGAYLTNSKMEMSGGDIKNNTATTSGGGAYLTNAATITVEGNISTNHANNGYGGGVYLTGTGTKLTVKGNINGNTAKDGGGVAAFSTEKVEVSAGNIYDNTASQNGGGIYSDNTEIDLQGTLRSNTATGGNGGGAYLTNGADLTLKNGTVGESGFPNTANSGDGGGIYATGSGTTVDIQGNVQYNTAKNGGGVAAANGSTITIGGTITGNNATSKGGGVYGTDTNTSVTVTGNITANDANIGGGAAIESGAQIEVKGGQISGNESVNGGGGIYVNAATVKLVKDGDKVGTISNNTSNKYGGGGIYAENSAVVEIAGNVTGNHALNTGGAGGGIYMDSGVTLTLTGNVIGNDAAYYGGGIHINGGTNTLSVNGNVNDNEAGVNGGGIHIAAGTNTVTVNQTVNDNTAANDGGGIWARGSNAITVNNAVNSNEAGGNGGGIYVEGSGSEVNINGSLDENNAANGGGAYVKAATLNINKVGGEDGTVDGNIATKSGGGIYAENGSTVKVDGHMYRNTANGSRNDNCGGGAIYQSGGTLTVDGIIGGSEANANKAPNGRGGGVLVTDSCTGTVEGSVTYNEAHNGGGVGAFEKAQLTIKGYLDHNAASQNGGGAVVGSGATLNINGHMDNNSAANNGGGALVNGGILNVNRVDGVDGTVDGNTAADSGGGIMAANATITINGHITDNKATNEDGGAVNQIGGTLTVNGTVESNTAGRNGGGIYAEGGTITLDGNLLSNQATSGNGGGAYVMDAANLTITGSVHHNTATNGTNGLGGGIYATGANTVATVEGGGNIYQNTARNGGGAACRDGGKVVVNGGNVQNNTANSGGGGIHCFDALVEIQSGNIQNNYSKQFAGGMYVGGASTASVTGSVLNNVTDGNGGGIHCASTAGKAPTLTVNGNVEGNKAVTHGGGIYAMTSDGNVGPVININNGSILNNHANCTKGSNGTYGTYTTKASKNDGFGGGVYLSDAILTLTGQQNEDGTFVNGMIQNNSAVNGGGIYAIDANITITGGIRGNEAEFVATNANKDTVLMGLGGGLCAYSKDGTSTITLTGNIAENTAQVFGGGAYIEGSGTSDGTTFGANFTQNSGYIYGNTATNRNGGGLLVSGNAIANIKGGIIRSNKALNGYGGGVHAYNGGHIVITGGSILLNEAKRGGGIAAEINAYVEFTNTVSMVDDGGSLSQNKATEYGGGIYAEASTVKVSGGTIDSNTARYGGGIAAVSEISVGASSQTAAVADVESSVTVSGGAITGNFAEFGGGVYAKDAATEVIVRGGNIVSNQARKDYADPDLTKDADGSGGGVYVDNASVQVNKPNATAAAGMVTANEAARGGGVYVTNGGDLTVKGGYIINNLAHGNEGVTGTALNQNANLLGTGGGIFVADGVSGNYSTFTLLAQDEEDQTAPVAIFGNLADYAADDVFANGVKTDLNVPLVTQMDLAGYPFQPGGWFEDYPIDDPSYTSGLNGGESMGITNNNVYRYRGSAVIYRIEIAPSDLNNAATLPANIADRYVCMTLGIPGAVGEEIVLDFGLNADMELLDNDLVIKDNYYLTTNLLIGKNHPFGGDNKPLEYQNLGEGNAPSGFGSELIGDYGTLTVTSTTNADGTLNFKVTYKLHDMKFIGVETFTYAVCYQDIWYYADVKIIPASVIYFEEGYVKVEDGKWTYVPNGSSDETNADVTQDGDRPGEDIGNALGNLDMDNVYGYDSHYVQNNKYSMGVALMTTVWEGKDATATFEFWGTGFDVISLCSNKSGAIMVTVKRLDKTGVKDRYLMVDTYYSYTYKDGKWSVSTQSDDNATYQIPVMSVTDLEYGKYWVEIYVAYENFVFDHGQYNGAGKYDFYLDAIRIYDPVNYKDPYEKDNEGNNTVLKDGMDTILNAYDKDGEYAPTYAEIRDLILGKAQCDALGKIPTPGALFIDGGHEVKDYISYGPNNELYLDKGESLTFTITNSASLAKVQLAMKSLGGAVKVTITDGTTTKTIEINTATDLYYDISEFIGKTVVLKNASDNAGALLSITNKKVTYKYDNGNGASMEGGDFVVDGDTANDALRLLGGGVTDPEIALGDASLSFEDEVKYNFYYTVGNPADIVEMGLVLFGQRLEDGTVNDANQVIPGYVTNGTEYMVSTDGIPAKNMGDVVYFKIYAKLSDGSYAYSDVAGYSAAVYARNILKSETASAKSKAMVVAMLNYGAAAQEYFGYDTENLMNSFLTEEQKALVEGYDASGIAGPVAADVSKSGEFIATEGFGRFSASASFEGAFTVNYYVTVEADAEVTMYYWTLADYAAADVLTAENATGAVVMEGEGEKYAAVTGIAAKEMEDTIYVAMVYEVDGVRYCSGVRAYSLAAYCKNIAAKNGSAMQELAKATAVYGSYAKEYFA